MRKINLILAISTFIFIGCQKKVVFEYDTYNIDFVASQKFEYKICKVDSFKHYKSNTTDHFFAEYLNKDYMLYVSIHEQSRDTFLFTELLKAEVSSFFPTSSTIIHPNEKINGFDYFIVESISSHGVVYEMCGRSKDKIDIKYTLVYYHELPDEKDKETLRKLLKELVYCSALSKIK